MTNDEYYDIHKDDEPKKLLMQLLEVCGIWRNDAVSRKDAAWRRNDDEVTYWDGEIRAMTDRAFWLYSRIGKALAKDEPRVLAVDELRECETYWIEDETGRVIPEIIMDISGKNIMTIPVVHLTDGYAPIVTKSTDGYGSKYFTGWRCWTKLPTDAQMKAVPWEEGIPT